MATDNSTATTHKDLAEQLPLTFRPFAVWFNDDPDCDNRKWTVNDEQGNPFKEFSCLATALTTANKASTEWYNEAGAEWEREVKMQAQMLATITDVSNRDNMATNDSITSTSTTAPVRFAIASIVFGGGGVATIRIENESTGEVAAMTPGAIAKAEHIIRGMTPEDALMVGLWCGKEQAKRTEKLNAQEIQAA